MTQYLNSDIVRWAEELHLNITEKFIYGMINGVLVTIEKHPQRMLFKLNLFNLNELDRENIITLISPKNILYKFTTSYNKNLETLSVDIISGVFSKPERSRQILEQIISIIKAEKRENNDDVEFYNGNPVFVLQQNKLMQEDERKHRSIFVRLLKVIFMTSFAIVFFGLLHVFFKNLQLNRLIFLPAIFPTFVIGLFFKNVNHKVINIKLNIMGAFILSVVLTSFFYASVVILSIDPAFNKSLELIFYVVKSSFIEFPGVLILCTGFLMALVSILTIYSRHTVRPLTLEQAKIVITGQRRFSKIMIFGFCVMIITGMYLIKAYDYLNYNSIITPQVLMISILVSVCILGCVYLYLKKNKIPDSIPNTMATSVFVVPLCIIATIFLNIFLDNSRPLQKNGYISYFYEKESSCYQVIDSESGKVLPMSVCNGDDKYAKPMNKITYFVKSGFFNSPIYTDMKIIYYETIEQLLEANSNRLENIKGDDIRYLLQSEPEKEKLYGKYLDIWKIQCEQGKAVFCRFYGYLLEAQGHPLDKVNQFMKRGCDLGEYSSCFASWYSERSNQKIIKQHQSLARKACYESYIDACTQYISLNWQTTDSEIKKEMISILNMLCQNGDKNSCNNIIWEKSRI